MIQTRARLASSATTSTLSVVTATGAYTAERAAALSGVPMSTLHWWARQEILVPSVSPTKVKLWSYTDLLALRTMYWLRRRKTAESGVEIPRTTMPSVRRALRELQTLSLPVSSLLVDSGGRIHIRSPEGVQAEGGQLVHEFVDLIAPFETVEGTRGPDLVRPRPTLRIVPGKLGGSPHVDHTRLETRAIVALRDDGLSASAIRELYPYLSEDQIADSIDLEEQLARNLHVSAAA